MELHAHYILVSDGGELQVGSPEAPFQHKAHIYLYGSLHSPPLFPYGVKFLAVRNGTLSIHGEYISLIVKSKGQMNNRKQNKDTIKEKKKKPNTFLEEK